MTATQHNGVYIVSAHNKTKINGRRIAQAVRNTLRCKKIIKEKKGEI